MITAAQARTIGYTHEDYFVVCLECAEREYGLSAHFDDYERYTEKAYWPRQVSLFEWQEYHAAECDDDDCDHIPSCDNCGVDLR